MPKPKESDIMTDKEFASLQIAPFLIASLQKMQKTHLTKVQEKAIGPILAGKDVAVKAKTGSGKSLAFLLPILDILYRLAFKPRNGTGVLIITPTRELAIQLYDVAKELSDGVVTLGLAVGGTSKVKEEQRLVAGAALVIGTPGRLRDHMENTRNWNYYNLFYIVFDEADLLLDLGFEEEIDKVMRNLPKKKYQVCLFSATLSDRIYKIKGVEVDQQQLVKIDADGDKGIQARMRANFEQGYVVCAPELRFLLLYSFLKKKAACKIICFMSTCASVQFYAEFLRYVGMQNVLQIQGKMKQTERIKAYNSFIEQASGVLFATNVASRGLDIPDVDFVIQFDPPDSIESYIHRAGRACRGDSQKKGVGILFLMEHERQFVNVLIGAGVPMSRFEFGAQQVLNVSGEFKQAVSENYYLLRSAQDAFKTFVTAYASHSLKQIFNLDQIDLEKLASSYGLPSAPRVDQVVQMWRARRKAELKREHHAEKNQGPCQDEVSSEHADEKRDEM